MRSLRQRFLVVGVLLVPVPAVAQVGTTTDIITGVILSEDGVPLVGAVVEAISLETEISRQAQTDPSGRYTILFPDGGGRESQRTRVGDQ